MWQSAIEEDILNDKDDEGKGEEETARRLVLLSPDWVPSMSPFSSVSSLSSLDSLWDSLNESASEVALKEEEPQEELASPPEEDGEDQEDGEALDLPCPPPGEHLEASVIEFPEMDISPDSSLSLDHEAEESDTFWDSVDLKEGCGRQRRQPVKSC
ncbi:uncharacterized protein LOC144326097 [Podarcis muralis]